MTLDSKALADQAWRDLEIAADATGKLEVARVTLPIEKVRALVECRRSALPAGEVGELVAELRNEAFRHELQHLRSSVEIDHLFQKSASVITALSARIEAVEAENERLRAAISWIEPPFVDELTPVDELRFRVTLCVKDAALSRRVTTGVGIMVDLVERLKRGRWYNDDDAADLMAHAAAEIESLRARLAEKDKALEPFAEIADMLPAKWRDHETHWHEGYGEISVGQLRRAREAWGGEDG